MTNQERLSQYFTPRWAAEAIVEHHFSHLKAGDLVVEPSCGDGRFLAALPAEVRAIGVEIDPAWAQVARDRMAGTQHTVLTGDFLSVDLPTDVDAMIGNPPFQADVIAGFLDRAYTLLKDGGQCGLILPTYVLQTSSKVMAMAKNWSIEQQLMPRNVFAGLSVPLCFTMFRKEQHRRLFGFFLYENTHEVAQMATAVRKVLNDGAAEASPTTGGSVWRQAVHAAFDLVDAETAPLAALYAALEGKRPSSTQHHRAIVRRVLQEYPEFEPLGNATWARRRGRSAANDAAGARRQLALA